MTGVFTDFLNVIVQNVWPTVFTVVAVVGIAALLVYGIKKITHIGGKK